MREKAARYWSWLIIGLFFIVISVYILIKGDGIYVQIHDYLDLNIAWFKMMQDNELFWSISDEVPFLGGIDRNFLPSELKAYTWLYMIFPAFPATIIGWYLKICMSIVGFVFLAKVIGDDFYRDHKNLIVWVGFLYGILPTYPPSAFSFASLPILLGLLILLYRNFRWKYILGLLLYPVLSDFTFFGIFICGYLVLFFIIDWVAKRTPKWRMLVALTVLSVGYIVVEWRLFYVMLFSEAESLRSTMVTTYLGAWDVIKESIWALIRGQYHAGSLHTFIVLPTCFVYFLALNIPHIKAKNGKAIYSDPFNWLMLLLGFNAIVYGLEYLESFKSLVSILLPPLTGFNFGRTLWFNPFIWYLAFLLVLCRIKKDLLKNILCILAFFFVCVGPEVYNPIFYNTARMAYDVFGIESMQDLSQRLIGLKVDLLTYREFYSEELFDEIKGEIDYDGEWSVAFGMHPAVLQYNGIATLDGYLSYYPLEYKNMFRELIEPELKIDESNRSYFDNWGGRAYIYSNEISYGPNYEMASDAADLRIDPDVFREMGGQYVFSRVMIKNADELGLEQVGVYTHDESLYTIYVYQTAK